MPHTTSKKSDRLCCPADVALVVHHGFLCVQNKLPGASVEHVSADARVYVKKGNLWARIGYKIRFTMNLKQVSWLEHVLGNFQGYLCRD